MSTILGLDVGSKFVKAVLFDLENPDQPKLLAAINTEISSSIISACEETLMQIEDQSGERISSAVIGITGESVKSTTTSVKYTRPDPKNPISETEISEILQKVEQKTKETLEEKNLELSLVNSAIVSFSVDDQPVMNPIDLTGTEVSALIYTAFAPVKSVSAIEKLCVGQSLDLLTIAVEPFAAARVLLEETPDPALSSVILDIGDAITNLALIKDGGIKATKSFPIGYRHIKKNPNTWFSGLEIICDEIGEVLPSNIILCGGGASDPEFQENLATSSWFQDLPFKKRPVVSLFDMEKYTPADHTYTVAVGLALIGADILASTPKENKLKTKINRILSH